ncbi:peptidoglycan-binding domain-containing protein [Schaalia sp. lx-100]|uniref:peptidoglycan-binding domain-containing protein n=1 Tax=Schaalia sp. lx-100 TaxID=2899081 RepID=UPI001E4C2195|nr:peptidoglycan-binding domain-containing protein [Schaalia sp. lx-100]MCD4557356.1 peptidoglycan-binding protein [Schaalia sp. lx-100]
MRAKVSPGFLLLLFVLAALCAAVGWAAHALLLPSKKVEPTAQYAIGQVVQGHLGRNLSLAAKAEWVVQSSVSGKFAGTLTSIPTGRQGSVSAGDVLCTVDLRPIFVLPGQVPAFRDMGMGVEGTDVAQLQAYLFEVYGRDMVPNGKFGDITEGLVKKWQKDHDLEVTGVIPVGQVVFIPSLPVNIAWEDDVHVGSEVQSGTKLVKIFDSTPTFMIPLPEGQLRATHEGQEVLLEYEGHTWHAVIDTIIENSEEHTLLAQLAPVLGQDSICADTCESIPVAGLKGISANVILVPEEEGAQIPLTAIRVDAQGRTVVVDVAGTQYPVSVRTSVGGQAIVDGIDVGMKIRLWGDPQQNGTQFNPQSGLGEEAQSEDLSSQSEK